MTGEKKAPTRKKRTRYTRKYVIHLPRIVIREPGIYEITIKNPLLVIEKVGCLPRTVRTPSAGMKVLKVGDLPTGEIERGSSDTEEDERKKTA